MATIHSLKINCILARDFSKTEVKMGCSGALFMHMYSTSAWGVAGAAKGTLVTPSIVSEQHTKLITDHNTRAAGSPVIVDKADRQ